MSTRALYTFIDNDSIFHAYKHHDGYPSGAAQWIEQATLYAWELPRFEASDFSAAFVAANKTSGGGVYLSDGNHGDLSYRYEISKSAEKPNELEITAFKFLDSKSFQIFRGSLELFKKLIAQGAL